MTRFARARGSKGSNEKVPEEATSWQAMKKQLQESQIKQESSGTSAKLNVQQLLHGHDDAASIKTEWATFENNKSTQRNSKISSKKNMKHSLSNSLHSNENVMEKKDVLSKTQNGKVKKSKKLKVKKSEISEMLGNDESKVVVRKKKTIPEVSNDIEDTSTHVQNGISKQKNKKGKKKLKSVTSIEDPSIPFSYKPGIDVQENKKNSRSMNNTANKRQKKNKLTKSEKIERGKPYNRRKPLQNDMVMTINGKEISMSFFDGFIVKKEDAERLTELEKKLKAKGIPKAEIREAMKLERRKAEKALAREKKKVCFHCRNSGHVLSECPELASVESTGICYKCGSTEHKISECRVGKTGQYRFAQCFVCSEQGHISSQCPKNSKGLYPKGGGCHVCGDVTHLKRDCPKLQQEQETQQSQSLTIGTINSRSLEALDVESKPNPVHDFKKSKKAKHIVF